MKKEKKQKTWLIIIFVGILIYTGYEYIVKGQIVQNSELEEQSIQLKGELIKITPYINNKEGLVSKIEENKEEVEQINDFIPYKEDTSEIIEYFYQTTKKYGLQGEKVTFERVKSRIDNSIQLIVQVNVKGDKQNIEKFIEEVQYQSYRLMTLKEIKLSPFEDSIYQANIRIFVPIQNTN